MLGNVTHGVEVDVCKEHGVWLDKGELEKIMASMRDIYRAGLADRAKQGQERGRLEGIFLGWWSLLLPKR